MPRKPNIKMRESDIERLERKIERFNEKIYRTRRRHPELTDIQPETIKKADKIKMLEELKNSPRSEFNKQLNSLERYTKKGAEKAVVAKNTGNKVTRWEKNEVSLQVAQVNRERTRERKAYEADKPSLTTRTMGEMKHNELKPKKFDFNKIRPGMEWEKFKTTVRKQAKITYSDKKVEQYKQNYLGAIRDILGQEGDKLYKFIEKVPANVLYKKYWDEDPVLRIQFISDPLPAKDIADESLAHWKTNLGEDYSQGLDDYGEEIHR